MKELHDRKAEPVRSATTFRRPDQPAYSVQLSEQSYRELYDLAPVSFLTLDKRGLISGLNKAAAAMLGFRSEWLRGRPFLVFIAPHHVRQFLGLMSRVRQMQDHPETMLVDL